MTNVYRSLKDHVYDHIVDLADGGTLAGEVENGERRICDALGVSRTPVRGMAEAAGRRGGEELQRSIRDLQWSIDHAKFLVW